MKPQTIVLLGATGDLGGRIARELVKQGANVRALVRKQSDLPKEIEQRIVDFRDHDQLVEACRGADCVVSAVNGLASVILELQSRVLKAAIAAHVPRFIPSDYSLDYTKTKPGDNRNLDLRRAFREVLDTSNIKATSILNGAFMDMINAEMPLIADKLNRVMYWGDADQAYDFTTKDDVAKVTARVALDPNPPRDIRVAGESASPQKIAEIASGALGKPFKLFRLGGVGRLSRVIGVVKALTPASTSPFPVWQGMQYMRDMTKGAGLLSPLENEKFHEIKFTSLREILSLRRS